MTTELQESWYAEVAAVFGSEVAESAPVQGGDISEVLHVRLEDGQQLAVKRGPYVGTEARMLQAMAVAGAPVPTVLHQGGRLLCLDWLEETGATPAGWKALGKGLRILHDVESGEYGWIEDYSIGSVPVLNGAQEDWPSFWAENRLMPMTEGIPRDIAARVYTLARTLGDRLPEKPQAALLHGDMWSGNALFSGKEAWLIDPACYHGHAEVDLAMLELFGTPDAAFWEGYGSEEPERSERTAVYQLWPALTHLRLFGDSYRGMVERLLDSVGA